MLNKVYVVDDDEMSLYITKFVVILYAPGCVCVCFDNAQQALDALTEDTRKNSLPNLVLLDLNMPVISGFDFLIALAPLASEIEAQGCKICILTSSVDEQDKVRSLENSLVLDLIQKPLTKERLAEVSHVLSKHKA